MSEYYFSQTWQKYQGKKDLRDLSASGVSQEYWNSLYFVTRPSAKCR